MNKVICAALSLISFAFGFLLFGYITVKWGQNTDKWGDLATWTGSAVAFLALIAAIIAAILSKRASDVANENSTFLSLNTFIDGKSEKFSLEYTAMKSHVFDFEQKVRCVDAGSAPREEIKNFFYETWGNILKNALEMKSIFLQTRSSIIHTKISPSSRDELLRTFLDSLDREFVWEALFQSLTQAVMKYSEENFLGAELFYRNYMDIVVQMNDLGMYPELFDQAKKMGKIDYLTPV